MSIEFQQKSRYDFDDLISIITALRAPDGCPWDREQTHESIKKNFIEETYEVVEAINKNDVDGIREELGDVLMQIALHSEMESEKGNFNINDVVDDLVKKLVFRHPHVFGDVSANNCAEALNSWDNAKAKEKGIKSTSQSMLRVPRELPALMRAEKVQHKASKVGFDWDSIDGAMDKLYEEINELKTAISHNDQAEIEDEFGDILFSCVNISRFINVDSEQALTCATDKFMSRFFEVEKLANERGIDMNSATIDALDMLWNEVKKNKNNA